uniref:Deacetylase sirtuin-type domain-containing protein n=1 Tax=Eutreptiella gymnastica TaxID=73025 RepID=A0A6U8EGT2_9EUGL|mmetsp:Transcript_36113/g.64594  ORF Transcript_36113/g.64594 Transcript_36113/m.64594 type:complete len:438 (+) Transcript_36113:571-1884(+)
MHGRGYEGPLTPPQCTWKCSKPPRDDHDAPSWLTASEYQDQAAVLRHKCRQLAQLLRLSRKTVLYTGAGISAAVIGQAARSGTNKQGWKGDTREAKPTPTHIILGFLAREGHIHDWVQQNHDGLPQKAGFPQHLINEIHGSWYDPSNPVVKYSGTLHDRAYPWMKQSAKTADLVLVLGTSLGGLNADQVATNAAERSLVGTPGGPAGAVRPGVQVRAVPPGHRTARTGVVTEVWGADTWVQFRDFDSPILLPPGTHMETLETPEACGALGTVIINLQQTEQDGKATLRLFGKSDVVLQTLLKEMGYGSGLPPVPRWPRHTRALVPYDANGCRLPGGKRMWLDLSEGQRIRITPGHNIQGAKQPMYMHIGAKKPVKRKGQTVAPGPGLGRVVRRDEASCSYVLQIEGATMRLGLWWLEAASQGTVGVLPIVNATPAFE